LREIRWEQIGLIHKKALTVGKSKTDAGMLSRYSHVRMEAKRRALDSFNKLRQREELLNQRVIDLDACVAGEVEK
jgi:hypothetical protein